MLCGRLWLSPRQTTRRRHFTAQPPNALVLEEVIRVFQVGEIIAAGGEFTAGLGRLLTGSLMIWERGILRLGLEWGGQGPHTVAPIRFLRKKNL